MSNFSLFTPPFKNNFSILKLAYWLILAGLGVSAAVFYYFQNHSQGLGGSIALPKLFWLAYVLWFWYFLPLLIGFDTRIDGQLRRLYWIFWLNMVLRAVAELWMMYVSHNWHPYYGIFHDVLSALLIFSLVCIARAEKNLAYTVIENFQIVGWMFLIESYFAWYMLHNVQSDRGPVYFVPGSDRHFWILLATWVVVIGLTIQQIVFAHKWLYEPANS